MKNKIVIILLSLVFSQICAMDTPMAKPPYFEQIPEELKLFIIKMVSRGTSLKEVTDNLKNLRITNKEFNRLIDDQLFTEWLLNELKPLAKKEIINISASLSRSVKDPSYLIVAALYLNTPKALEWLTNYIKSNPEIMLAAEDIFIGIAIQQKNSTMLNALLKSGVSPNAQSHVYSNFSKNVSALAAAASRSFKVGVQTLLAAGADVNNGGKGGIAPLFYAITEVERDDLAIDTIRILLNAGANPNSGGHFDNSLGQAIKIIRNGPLKVKVVTMLLDAGANPNSVKQGKTALDIASSSAFHSAEVIDLLKKRGAKKASELE